MLDVKILTAYPEMFPGSLEHSLIGKALKENIFKISTIDLHQFGIDERMSIDDEPFGGGPGMVLRPDVVEKALNSIPTTHNIKSTKISYPLRGTIKSRKIRKFSKNGENNYSLWPF